MSEGATHHEEVEPVPRVTPELDPHVSRHVERQLKREKDGEGQVQFLKHTLCIRPSSRKHLSLCKMLHWKVSCAASCKLSEVEENLCSGDDEVGHDQDRCDDLEPC